MSALANSEAPDEMQHNYKYNTVLHFNNFHFVKVKQTRNTIVFTNYNLTSLYLYNGLSQIIVSNQKEQSISYTKG